jgi:bacterioferritin-associated ferredoxin
MIVCLCRGVSDRVLRSVIAAGAATLDDVSAACGAGADCRSCASAVAVLIEEARESARRRTALTARLTLPEPA